MKQNKNINKLVRVYFKLYLRHLRRTPHVWALSLMSVLTLTLSTYVVTSAILNSRLGFSTFTLWEQSSEKARGRGIANTDKIQCDFDEFNLGKLKAEIQDIEKSFETGHSIEGNLFSLNLSKLPFIQAQFLADNREYLGEHQKSYNNLDCKDALCVLTSLYGNEEASHLAYYWYLKTGSVLSMSNRLPGQKSKIPGKYNNEDFSYSQYLFTNDELKNFYILAKSLPSNFIHTPLLKSIHKIPGSGFLEGSDSCKMNTATGAILIGEPCLGFNTQTFLKNITKQIADFVEREQASSRKISSISLSKSWLDRSLWSEKSFYNLYTGEYQSKWESFLPKENFITRYSMQSPQAQLRELLATYRFKPVHFSQKTPSDLQNIIKNDFYNGKSYDGNGLYKQYIETALSQWSKEEADIWEDCLDSHIKKNVSPRDLANKVDSPLFSCVERKIPEFVSNLVVDIKANDYQGCKFFDDSIGFSHLSDKFYSTVDKYLQERVLKRKIELQNHGDEVIIGQSIKDKFVSSVDPISYYIQCFEKEDQEACYNQKLLSKIDLLLIKNKRELSKYYSSILRKEMQNLYTFNEQKDKSNSLTKRYLAPFYNKVKFAAVNIWEQCKSQKFSQKEQLELPMKFTGGKHFVNAKLLNCLNSKIDGEVFDIVDFKASRFKDGKKIEFSLTHPEKVYAKSFLEKRIVQIFNSILEKEVLSEKAMNINHFKVGESKIIESFIKDKSFYKEVYSLKHVNEKCIEKLNSHYPSKYFFSSKEDLDKSFGSNLCAKIITNEKVSSLIQSSIQKYWEKTKKKAESHLDGYFADYVDDCKDDYPLEPGRGLSRNKRMRSLCIQESFKMALADAIDEWREDDLYEYFSDKEVRLGRELASLKESKVLKKMK